MNKYYTTYYWKFLCKTYFSNAFQTIYLDSKNEKWKWLYPLWKQEVNKTTYAGMGLEQFNWYHKLKFKLIPPPEDI